MEEDFDKKSDEELVILSIEDKANFSYVIERYKDKLRRYIKRLTSTNDEYIDDILQEIFIKTYINLKGFDPKLKFSSWIYRIAHNESISFYRKNHKHLESVYYYEDESLESISDEMNVEVEAHRKEFQKNFSQAINELEQKYKDVIVLKFIEGKNYDEISDILKKPPGTIATRINRAKKKLRENIKKKGFDSYE